MIHPPGPPTSGVSRILLGYTFFETQVITVLKAFVTKEEQAVKEAQHKIKKEERGKNGAVR